jgi:hypothetical protein
MYERFATIGAVRRLLLSVMVLTTTSCSKSKVAVIEDAAAVDSGNAAEGSAPPTIQEGFIRFELDDRESFENLDDAGLPLGSAMRHLTRGVSTDGLVTIVGKTATHSEPKQGPTGQVDDMTFDIDNKGSTPRTIGISQIQLVRSFGCQSPDLQVDTRTSLTRRSLFAYDDHSHSISDDAGLLTIAPHAKLHTRITVNEPVPASGWCITTAFRVRFQLSSPSESSLFTQLSATAETHYVRREPIRRK